MGDAMVISSPSFVEDSQVADRQLDRQRCYIVASDDSEVSRTQKDANTTRKMKRDGEEPKLMPKVHACMSANWSSSLLQPPGRSARHGMNRR